MSNDAQILNKHKNEREALLAMYDAIPQVGVEALDMNAKKLVKDIGLRDHAGQYFKHFEELGILTRRMEYGTNENGLGFGRHFHWTIHMPREEALAVLTEAHFRENVEIKNHRSEPRRKKEKVVARPRDGLALATSAEEEVRAVAGPEPDNTLAAVMPTAVKAIRKDEAGALIEAARQYRGRTSMMRSKIDELEKLAQEIGMKFDKEIALGALHEADVDERLEAIANILPYIDSLEATVKRLSDQIATRSEKSADADILRAENRRLRERIDRLISAKVDVQSSAASH